MHIKLKPVLVLKFLLPAALLIGLTKPVFANDIYVTAESPGVQQSSLYLNPTAYGATGVIQNSFDTLSPQYYSTSIPFNGNAAIGIYSDGGIQRANQYGGAGGTSNYYTVAAPFSTTTSTLTFSTPQRYFGFWLSALDANNHLAFYSNSTLVDQFTAQDVLNFINRQANAQAYFGNPTSNFRGQDSWEPFAFLNFFVNPSNQNVTFNKIVFSNNNSRWTGFESDNHTIAASYKNMTGKPIAAPFHPASALGMAIVSIGYILQFLNARSQKSQCKPLAEITQ